VQGNEKISVREKRFEISLYKGNTFSSEMIPPSARLEAGV
jgi:hypothetical protein